MDIKKRSLFINILAVNGIGCLTFFIFEPLKNYLCNRKDYWFDFGEFVGLTSGAAGVAFLAISAFLILLSLLMPKAVHILVQLDFFLIVGLYIQSNLIPSTIGPLDGTSIDWTKINPDMVCSDILWILIIACTIVVLVKMKKDKQTKLSVGVSLGLFLLETVTVVSLFISDSPFDDTNKKFFMSDCEEMELSEDENLLIFVVDCFDSSYFREALTEDFESELEGFTYYPDTTSMYGHTLCSLSQILTGIPFVNQSSYEDYETEAFERSPLLEKLREKKWDYGLYSEYEFPMTESLSDSVNLIDSSYKISSVKSFYEIVYRIVGYSIAPYHLKSFLWFYPQLNDIKYSKTDEQYKVYTTNNEKFYDAIDLMSVTKSESVFRFFHIEGMHTPYMTDENVVTQEKEVSFEQNREACFKIIGKFIEQLKAKGVYDNTAIIIMADHGGLDRLEGLKQNPLFMVKGYNEKHKFEISDRQFSYENIMEVYDNILNGKIGSEIIPEALKKTRTFYAYSFDYMDQMTEYEIDGKAWEAYGE